MLHILLVSSLILLQFTNTAWAAPRCSLRAASSAASAAGASPTDSSQSPSGSVSNNNNNQTGRVAMVWYAGWTMSKFPFSEISWKKLNVATWSFAVTTPDVNVVTFPDSPDSVADFVKEAQSNNVKALVTVGGWTGSQYFSSAFATPENRTAFVSTMVNLVKNYTLDGLDFDWEYPGRQGLGCNIVSGNDSDNFLSFLQELRKDPEMQNKVISAAVSVQPFADTTGTPKTDVSGFAKVLDFIEVMNYDVFGTFSNAVGPNAPLNDTCVSNSQDQEGSAVSAVQAWTKAGFPANQIVLGVPAYGHGFLVDSSAAFDASSTTSKSSIEAPAGTRPIAAYPSFNKNQVPMGDSSDVNSPPGIDSCGDYSSGGYSGLWNFWGLIDSGMLYQNGTAAPGVGFRFDDCSQTPFVYNETTQTMISYDDPQSFAAKGKFIAAQSMRGFAMWDASGDYKDILLDSISSAMNS